MSEPVPFVYRVLNAEERLALEEGLALAARLAEAHQPLSMDQVQALYDLAIVGDRENNDLLIAIGLAFGAQVVALTGFDWVRLSDQWGEETVVGPVGKSLNCAPISMIQKRVSRREPVQLASLASTIVAQMQEKLADGEVGDW